MIYDRRLSICIPPEGFGAPFHGRLMPWREHLCCELTVFHRRYWQALQAGSRADRMVQIPMGQDVLPGLSIRTPLEYSATGMWECPNTAIEALCRRAALQTPAYPFSSS